MRIRLAAFAIMAVLATEARAAPGAAPAKPFRPVKVDWGDTGKARAYHYGDLTLTMSAQKGKFGKAPVIAVSSPRQGKASLTGQESPSGAPRPHSMS